MDQVVGEKMAKSEEALKQAQELRAELEAAPVRRRPPPVLPPHMRNKTAAVPAPAAATPPKTQVDLLKRAEMYKGNKPGYLYGRDVGSTAVAQQGRVGQVIKSRNVNLDGGRRRRKRKNMSNL